MVLFNNINLITVIIGVIFVIPIAIGIISPFSTFRMQRSLGSLLNSVIFLVSMTLSVYLTNILLADTESALLTKLYKIVPSIYGLITSKNVWVYFVVAILMTAAISGILHLLTMPVYRFVIVPVTNRISTMVSKMSDAAKRIFGGVWELPKAMILVIVFSLFLNFWSGYKSNTIIEKTISTSAVYQFVETKILNPVLSSSIAKKIPVLLSDSFKEAAASLEAGDIHLIHYFNGMTLDVAVKSSDEIDTTAKKIIGNKTDEKEKAKLIYDWISKNITYDNEKAAAVAIDPTSVSSGAVVAYNTKTGICFDYACLFVAMCRAVDVKVRFATGLGYSGTSWGDHAWNQAYGPAEDKWINVDTTFGSSGKNYFNRTGFNEDHQYAVVQGAW